MLQRCVGGIGSGRHQAFIDGTRVIVTTPEGLEEGFTFRAIPDQRCSASPFPGKATLIPIQATTTNWKPPLAVSVNSAANISPLRTTYNPRPPNSATPFQVTSIASRITYNVNATTGETASIEDRNENKLELRYEGIISSTGRSVTFQRDMLGRIVAITDPRGNSLRYSYDSAAGLYRVTEWRREDYVFDNMDRLDLMQHFQSDSKTRT